MPTTLSTSLRRQLETITQSARDAATLASRAALENLAVHEADYRPHMSIGQRRLRNRLRARGRALGDAVDSRTLQMDISHLGEEAAYEHWHRLLFTRFLAENHLLHTDAENGSVPVTLDECEELAPELGARDGFDLACRFASQTLPGVFRKDDPILDLPIAANDRVKLRGLLDSIPREVFTAGDALGWTYQFWQTQRKADVNASGKKIGADEISPVTQLFTEDYMVEFLLHNTLGAWWAGKQGPITAASEAEARAKVALPLRDGLRVDWTYLRFIQDEATGKWLPAAGTFAGWPQQAADITYLDLCMGSGHFPVFALPIIARLRMEEEGLSAADAIYATLRDNIHGLEIDPRCCQIGAFNLALTAWKLGGYQPLPALHVACCGLAPQAKLADWVNLAGDNDRMRRGMERLYKLFEQAPILGSLINPRQGGGDLIEADFSELQPLLAAALTAEAKDDAEREMKVTASGIAKAAELLAGRFTLVATNVPYLARGKQDESLRLFCERHFPEAKNDLANVFLEHCLNLCHPGGSTSIVLPQNWLFLTTYKAFRQKLLQRDTWHLIARLGPGAFETISGEVVKAILITLSRGPAAAGHPLRGLDVSTPRTATEKAAQLLSADIQSVDQARQLLNPDARVAFEEGEDFALLSDSADGLVGLQSSDDPMFITHVWEHDSICKNTWEFMQGTPSELKPDAGASYLVRWEQGKGRLLSLPTAYPTKGLKALGRSGFAIHRMDVLYPYFYYKERFHQNVAVIIPHNPTHLPAIWCFCSSPEYNEAVRQIDQALKVTNATLVKVPFDMERWSEVAAERYPHGLPQPFSNDPTQWIFHGHPGGSVVWDETAKRTAHGSSTGSAVGGEYSLQVAVARLLGYRWPAELDPTMELAPEQREWVGRCDALLSHADADGIVCLAPVHGEQTAASRLRQLLSAALGGYNERDLIRKAGAKGSKSTSLEDWLRDEFFAQHCAIFHNRPFIWHIWDGLKDGFHALVNYHKLDHAKLKTLAYTYLGDWIREQKAGAEADEPGAAERLGAAHQLQAKLIAILEGEAPLDIFVRWKPLHEQPIGWHPDLNDGVRQNIRPFLFAGDVGLKGAGLFRAKPGIEFHDKPDRGTEPERAKADYPWFWCEDSPGTDPIPAKTFAGKRWNNVHLTLERKQAAREARK